MVIISSGDFRFSLSTARFGDLAFDLAWRFVRQCGGACVAIREWVVRWVSLVVGQCDATRDPPHCDGPTTLTHRTGEATCVAIREAVWWGSRVDRLGV